jgi:hypothetical protein
MRCKECVRELRSPVFVVGPGRLAAAGAAAFAISVVFGAVLWFARVVPFFLWLVALVAGRAGGAAVAEAASRASGRKRGETLARTTAGSLVLGTLVGWLGMTAFQTGLPPATMLAMLLRDPWGAVTLGLYVAMAVYAVLHALR